MWSTSTATERNIHITPARGFSTPPATWRTTNSTAAAVLPLSERKFGCKRDLFHVIHKVPAGDSPYVKAKHVQLIEKDPSRAISLFWAAINAGDRVDSALKDMAVVMKQLNRSDEAIEAIKSFRHLCPHDSQESIDNVLVELYKRSGRIEEEIEMLQNKLKDIEEGMVFGGKRTKIARSQGKKIQITVEQERSRILGNLAWAYLQHHDYGSAEQYYRKALTLEPDKNKQCNLAICLMHMNRLPEAKSLLDAVRASCGSKQMDESYAKSFERAVEMLAELESQLVLRKVAQDSTRNLGSTGTELSSAHNRAFTSPTPVLYTQPRRCSNNGDQRNLRWAEDRVEKPTENLLTHTTRNLSGELQDSTDEMSLQKSQSSLPSPTARDWRSTWRDVPQPAVKGLTMRSWGYDSYAHLKDKENVESNSQNKSWKRDMQENGKDSNINSKFSGSIVDNARAAEDSRGGEWDKSCAASVVSDNVMSTNIAEDKCLEGIVWTKSFNRSWADIVEEEEEFNDENLSSITNQQNSCVESQVEDVRQKLEAYKLNDGHHTSKTATFSRNQTARRSLCFGDGNMTNIKKRNRLQVFRDITPTPDSP